MIWKSTNEVCIKILQSTSLESSYTFASNYNYSHVEIPDALEGFFITKHQPPCLSHPQRHARVILCVLIPHKPSLVG